MGSDYKYEDTEIYKKKKTDIDINLLIKIINSIKKTK